MPQSPFVNDPGFPIGTAYPNYPQNTGQLLGGNVEIGNPYYARGVPLQNPIGIGFPNPRSTNVYGTGQAGAGYQPGMQAGAEADLGLSYYPQFESPSWRANAARPSNWRANATQSINVPNVGPMNVYGVGGGFQGTPTNAYERAIASGYGGNTSGAQFSTPAANAMLM